MKRKLLTVSVALALLAAPLASSPASAAGSVRGAIADKYNALGGSRGFLGQALTDEAPTTRGGAYNIFEGGLILWTEPTGARFVRGAVRSTWTTLGSEYGFLGFPTTDEVPSARGGAVQLFEGASIYWSGATGAHELYGGIREVWISQGYETGRLGFPTTGEFDIDGGRKQEFQGGNVVWTPQAGAVIAYPAVPPAPVPPAPIPPTTNLPAPRAYANCDELRAASPAYAHGIGLPSATDSNGNPPVTDFLRDEARYRAQSPARDADRDGVACEKI
jgi:uncharacterized protein with LGFP repeats